MSWQEELRRLDEELAAGRLSADDYRMRRDQVLSSAVGMQEPPVARPATSNADATQVIAPVSPPSGTPQPPADASAERTQAVAWRPQAHGDPNRTEYVQPVQGQPGQQFSPAQGFPQPAMGGADSDNAERTQVVPNAGAQGEYPPVNYQGYPQQQPQQPMQPGWNQVPPGGGTPWGNEDAPPPPGQSDLSWMRQGPEAFFENRRSSNRKKVITVAAAVVVVLLAGFSIWWFGLRSDSTPVANPTTNPTASAPSTTPPPPSIAPKRIPPMPGKASNKSGTVSVDDAVQKEILATAEGAAVKTAGSAYVTYNASTNSPFDYSVLLVNTKSVADANKLAQAMQNPSSDSGLQPVSDHAGLPQSVAVFKAVLSDHTTYQAVYVSGAAVLRVQVNQAPASDTAVTNEFKGVMKAMLENVPNS